VNLEELTLPDLPRRPRAWAGFTLVELMVALGMVAVLATLALPMYRGWQDKIKTTQAQEDIIAMSMVIDAFIEDNQRPPTSLTEVGRNGLKDPWGHAYVYADLSDPKAKPRKDHSLHPLNTDYDLCSKGPDGATAIPLTAKASRDDILRATNGRFVGPASQF
jgi:general secretion pathway protein G